ncbi:uncharacterized protein EV422DRAFT_72008 [Fimicolochytrium jonesii]|uniref:uncharacterized protein n=1 Tax=Fimicolochytrium jonesii TaxID=1396493 RepID=UPI0022FE6A05|nr:uncharacterized protein EV422DRAFT_72008 [Fimicolochytrium jonesii]KAI8820470.1 hypothetical protein EV422DRAFT_72008 [Fimicolochytrium jonesii]
MLRQFAQVSSPPETPAFCSPPSNEPNRAWEPCTKHHQTPRITVLSHHHNLTTPHTTIHPTPLPYHSMATGPDDDWPQRSRPLSPAEPNYHLPSHHHHHGHHASGEGHQQSHLISLPHPQNHGYHHQLPQPAILQSQTSSHRPSDDLSSFSTSNFGTSSAPHSPGLKSAGSQQQAYALSRPPSYDSSPAEEAAAMSFNSTSIPSEFVSQRKFSIDTNLKVEYDPPSPTFYTLPPMDSPAGRRRTLPIEPFAVNIGPFFKPTKQLHNICSIDRARL